MVGPYLKILKVLNKSKYHKLPIKKYQRIKRENNLGNMKIDEKIKLYKVIRF